jgi:glycosyltransferase involved in cell wall biosynthesis
MPEVYPKMDVLVLPSLEIARWKEQFGRVLVEAMASGVPVIGSRSGEIPNVVGEAGLLFDPGDVQSLVEQLRNLKETPDLWETLRKRGLARVRKHFTLERVGERLLGLLEKSLPHDSGE